MKPETLQQYFDIAWKHAVVDKNPPGNEDGGRTCRYRTANGCRCLIGAAVHDDDYTSLMEGKFAGSALRLIKYSTPTGVDVLQQCHDGIEPDIRLEDYHQIVEHNLRDFATQYRMEIPVAPVDGAA